MKKYSADVLVRRKKGVADPEGNTIAEALERLGYKDVFAVKVSRMFELTVNADGEEQVIKIAEEIAEKILANPVIEEFSISNTKEIT